MNSCEGNKEKRVYGHERGVYNLPYIGVDAFLDYLPVETFYKAYTGRYSVWTIPPETFSPALLRRAGYDEARCADACQVLKWCRFGLYYPFIICDEETQKASIHVLREQPERGTERWEHLLICKINDSVQYVDKKYPWSQLDYFMKILSYFTKGNYRYDTVFWLKNGMVPAVEFTVSGDVDNVIGKFNGGLLYLP